MVVMLVRNNCRIAVGGVVDIHLTGTKLCVHVPPGEASASACTVSGFPSSVIAGCRSTFEVTVKDVYGNSRDTRHANDTDLFSFVFSGDAAIRGDALALPTVSPMATGDGSYVVSFTANICGALSLQVKIGGEPVGGPLPCNVTPAAVYAGSCTLRYAWHRRGSGV